MHSPPIDPRDRPISREPDGPAILVAWAMVAAIFLLVWAASHPTLAVMAGVASGVLFLVGRRVRWLVRCYAECERLTVTLGRHVRLTIGAPARCEPGCCGPG